MKIQIAEKTFCSVCGNKNLLQVLDLPRFPITGIFLPEMDPERFPDLDQGLCLCQECGHAQLRYQIDPNYLYDNTYTHRSSVSPIAATGNDFFESFLRRVCSGRTFHRVLEIGCNDLYLLNKIQDMGERFMGLDPIWVGRDHAMNAKTQIVGGFVENLDCTSVLEGAPDLVISAHTFEHIDQPKQQLQHIFDSAAEGAIFLIEVPGFDTQLRNCRFDQVFHQHIQYFSVASMRRMIAELGGEYLDHAFNYKYWGGTMLTAFKKVKNPVSKPLPKEFWPSKAIVANRLALFRQQNENLMQLLHLQDSPIYGLGGAQMLPTICYHLSKDLSFIDTVLDDNPDRNGLTYPTINVRIKKPEPGFDLSHGTALILALDSARPLLKRAMEMNARNIFKPLFHL